MQTDRPALLITGPLDPIVEGFEVACEERGLPLLVLDREKYGIDWGLSWTSGGGRIECIVEHGRGTFDSRHLRSAFVRREFVTSAADAGRIGAEAEYIDVQQAIHVNSVLRWLSSRVPFMNEPLANIRAMSKMVQQQTALDVGLTVPRTFVGDSASLAAEFQAVDSCPLCKKPIEATRLRTEAGGVAVHLTKRFERRTLEELQSLKSCPCVLQQFIEKRDELRVTIVGQRVFACRIDTSSAHLDAQVDWRHYDWANTAHEIVELDETVRAQLLEFMVRLELSYGAIDLVRGLDGVTYFLEVNPLGQWLWIEDLTDVPISEAIIDWMENPQPAYSLG